MAWCRIHLTEDERRIVNEEREPSQSPGSEQDADNLAPALRGDSPEGCGNCWGVATVQRYVDAYCKGGLEGLRHSSVQKAVSELATFRDIIRASSKKHLCVRLPRRATESRS